MQSRSLCVLTVAVLMCGCTAGSDGQSVDPASTPTPTTTEPITPILTTTPATTTMTTESTTTTPAAAPATTVPVTVTQTLTLEFEGCERFTMPAIPIARDVATAYVGTHTPAVRDDRANASLHALQCNDLRTDGTSHGPGYFGTVFIAIDAPDDPPALPDDSGFVTKPTDYFAPVLFHTDNDGFQAAGVAFGVPMTRTESSTFEPAGEGLQSGSASDREFDPPISYRWTVDNIDQVEQTATPGVHTFLGPSLDDDDMAYYGVFTHDAGWSDNQATLELDPDSGLVDLLGSSRSGTANGTPIDIEMLVFREPPVPSGNLFEPFYPIEYAPGLRLRQVSPEMCSEPPRPAFVSPGPSSWWPLADRGVAVFDIDDTSRPDSSTFDEEFVGGIAHASAELGIAVQWLRANAAEYCIDPDAIVVAGYSWGAITALALAYSTGAVQPGDDVVIDELGPSVAAPDAVDVGIPVPPALAEFSAVPNAVISHAGFALPETIDAGEPPALLVHGRNDEVIPFDLAEQTCAAAVAVGVVCELMPHLNDHGFDGSLGTRNDTSMDAAIDFLNRHVLVPAGRAPLS